MVERLLKPVTTQQTHRPGEVEAYWYCCYHINNNNKLGSQLSKKKPPKDIQKTMKEPAKPLCSPETANAIANLSDDVMANALWMITQHTEFKQGNVVFIINLRTIKSHF